MRNFNVNRARFVGVSALAVALATGYAPAAWAADSDQVQATPASSSPAAVEAAKAAAAPDSGPPANADGTPATSEAIVVTGSRIPRAGFTAPTPVTVVGAEQLDKAAPSTIAESLRQLPSLTNTSGPQRNSGTANGGQSFLNLRSLGATRTLTLLDGRRVVPTNITGSVDVNILPSALVQRVEVVTGGASAAYGSDAVAGVVNFILDTKFVGLKGEVDAGAAEQGDDQQYRATLSGGISFGGGRGHLVASGDYFRNDGVKPGARPWADQGVALINNPNAPPTFLVEKNVLTVGTYGGLIISGNGGTAANNAKLKGIQFLPGGVPAPYNFGTLTNSTQQVGGDGVPTELIQEVDRPLERGSAFAHASYDLTDSITISAEGMYGRSTSNVNNSVNRRQTANPFTIQRDNAFLPASISAQMQQLGVTSLTMLRFSRERGYVYTHVDSETWRGVLSLDGKLGALKWGAYYQYGRTSQDTETRNDEITARFNNAIDAVVDPATGNVVCRINSSLDKTNGVINTANDDPNCAPFNVFGEGAPSDAALNYARGTSASHAVLQQQVAAVNIAGPLLNWWAGSISFATGAEYRKEEAALTSDPLSPTGAYLFGNATPWSGQYDVKEGYAELVVPLLKDLPFARELELNTAGRITDYSTSGTVETWKVGLSWKPVADLRFRGTRSRDIRAPNLSELFQTGRQSTASVTDPFNNNIKVTGLPQINTGNPNLTPEIANTLTVGAVYTPFWARGLNLSVDYYNIDIRDAIGAIGAQTAVDQCFQGVALACSLFTRNAAGSITRFTSSPINLASAKTSGVDIELDYRIPARQWFGWGGALNLRALAAYVGKQETQTPGAAPIDRAGEVGVNPFPYWRGTAQLDYDTEHGSAFLQMRYIGGGRFDVTRGPDVVALQHIPAQVYFDGQVSVKTQVSGANVEIFLNVRNILNHQPPFTPQDGNVPVAVNTTLYDVIGRTFRLGAKFHF